MSSYLILADTHLTHRFKPVLYRQLVKIISKHDRVILNGDFWDGYQTTFEKFVNSEWQQLFPLLKKKKTVYVEGNHDPFTFADARLTLFAGKQVEEFAFKSGNRTFHVEHGHRIGPGFSENHSWITAVAWWLYPLFHYIYEHNLIVLSPLYKKYIGTRRDRVVAQYKAYLENTPHHADMHIFSHAHELIHDEQAKFTVTGEWLPHYGSYVVVQDGILSLHETTF